MQSKHRRSLTCLLVVVASLLGAGAALAQSAGPAPDGESCNGLCQLFRTLSGKSGPQAAAPEPAAAAQTPAAEAAPKHKARHRVAKAAPHAVARAAAASPAKVVVASGTTENRLTAGVIAEMERHHITAAAQRLAPDGDIGASPADFIIVPAPLASALRGRPVVANIGVEQLHLVAGMDIHTIADLRDRPVSLGLNGSATQAAARDILKSLGIEVQEVPLEFRNGMDALSQGSLAAVAVLAPKPFEELAALSAGSHLHLIAIPASAAADAGRHPSTIAHADYPALVGESAVETVAVDAVLVGRDTPRARQIASQLRTLFVAAAQLPASEHAAEKPN
jgi:hypothetical protein